jgi:hypothetical protein
MESERKRERKRERERAQLARERVGGEGREIEERGEERGEREREGKEYM